MENTRIRPDRNGSLKFSFVLLTKHIRAAGRGVPCGIFVPIFSRRGAVPCGFSIFYKKFKGGGME